MGTFVCRTCGGTEQTDDQGNYNHTCPGKPKKPQGDPDSSTVPPGKKVGRKKKGQ